MKRRRGLLVTALALTVALAACGAEEQSTLTGAERGELRSEMYGCVGALMQAVSVSESVDTASDSVLNAVGRQVLQVCSDRSAVLSRYDCGSEGCYNTEGWGVSWDSQIERWAFG